VQKSCGRGRNDLRKKMEITGKFLKTAQNKKTGDPSGKAHPRPVEGGRRGAQKGNLETALRGRMRKMIEDGWKGQRRESETHSAVVDYTSTDKKRPATRPGFGKKGENQVHFLSWESQYSENGTQKWSRGLLKS